jgi:hypothetical protein
MTKTNSTKPLWEGKPVNGERTFYSNPKESDYYKVDVSSMSEEDILRSLEYGKKLASPVTKEDIAKIKTLLVNKPELFTPVDFYKNTGNAFFQSSKYIAEITGPNGLAHSYALSFDYTSNGKAIPYVCYHEPFSTRDRTIVFNGYFEKEKADPKTVELFDKTVREALPEGKLPEWDSRAFAAPYPHRMSEPTPTQIDSIKTLLTSHPEMFGKCQDVSVDMAFELYESRSLHMNVPLEPAVNEIGQVLLYDCATGNIYVFPGDIDTVPPDWRDVASFDAAAHEYEKYLDEEAPQWMCMLRTDSFPDITETTPASAFEDKDTLRLDYEEPNAPNEKTPEPKEHQETQNLENDGFEIGVDDPYDPGLYDD